jgi:5-bromo-4-chloroindolyl phosphate hydrolysis protein
MSEKLAKLESIMTRIFAQVKKQPESADDLRKFMTYYLPTTTKLVDAYRDLDGQPEYGTNVANTKKEIEDTLDTINEAFENLFDSLFEDTAWDISSDISTMKVMLQQEGLTGNRDFKANKQQED